MEEGHIQVEVKPDGDDILFRVIDDGVGMSPEQVEAIINQKPKDHTASASGTSTTG